MLKSSSQDIFNTESKKDKASALLLQIKWQYLEWQNYYRTYLTMYIQTVRHLRIALAKPTDYTDSHTRYKSDLTSFSNDLLRLSVQD